MKKTIGIFGFGRIGRFLTKLILSKYKKNFELIFINTSSNLKTIKLLLDYDSLYGQKTKIDSKIINNNLYLNNNLITVYNEKKLITFFKNYNLEKLDYIVDCTGQIKKIPFFLKKITKNLILSYPVNNKNIKNFVFGVNNKDLKDNLEKNFCISATSCTTQATASIINIFDKIKVFEIKYINVYCIHSLTNNQNILDNKNNSFYKTFSSVLNIVPSTSGSQLVLKKLFKKYKEKLNISVFRVPILNTSSITISFFVFWKEPISVESIKAYLLKSNFVEKNVFFSNTFVLSSLVLNTPYNVVVDLTLLKINKVKKNNYIIEVTGYFDTESSFSNNLLKLIE